MSRGRTRWFGIISRRSLECSVDMLHNTFFALCIVTASRAVLAVCHFIWYFCFQFSFGNTLCSGACFVFCVLWISAILVDDVNTNLLARALYMRRCLPDHCRRHILLRVTPPRLRYSYCRSVFLIVLQCIMERFEVLHR